MQFRGYRGTMGAGHAAPSAGHAAPSGGAEPSAAGDRLVRWVRDCAAGETAPDPSPPVLRAAARELERGSGDKGKVRFTFEDAAEAALRADLEEQLRRARVATTGTERSESPGLIDVAAWVGTVVRDVAWWAGSLAAVVATDRWRPVERVEAAAALATLAIRQPGTVRAAAIGHENEIFASAAQLLHDSVAGESADGRLSAAMAGSALTLMECLLETLATERMDLPPLVSSVGGSVGTLLQRARRDMRSPDEAPAAGAPSAHAVRLLWRLSEAGGSAAASLTDELISELGASSHRWRGAPGWALAGVVCAHFVTTEDVLASSSGIPSSGTAEEAAMADALLDALACALDGGEFDGVTPQSEPAAATVCRWCCSDRLLAALLRCRRDLFELLELGLGPRQPAPTQQACAGAIIHLAMQSHTRAAMEMHVEHDRVRSRLATLAHEEAAADTGGGPNQPPLHQLGTCVLDGRLSWPRATERSSPGAVLVSGGEEPLAIR